MSKGRRPDYGGEVLTAAALEAVVREARERDRARLATLDRLGQEHTALQEELADGMPETEVGWVQRLLQLVPGLATPPVADSAEVLEARLEAAQRRVLQLASHLDRLAADRADLHRERVALHDRLEVAEADADLAAAAILALEQAELTPAVEQAVFERETELRALQRMTKRMRGLLGLQEDFLHLNERLTGRITRLHEAAADVLEELDRSLARLAAEAQARDLARRTAGSMGSLRESVQRVNRIAAENAVLLTEQVDRLADEVDLLEPTDALALEAEREVQAYLRDRTVADAVARARMQVRRK